MISLWDVKSPSMVRIANGRGQDVDAVFIGAVDGSRQPRLGSSCLDRLSQVGVVENDVDKVDQMHSPLRYHDDGGHGQRPPWRLRERA